MWNCTAKYSAVGLDEYCMLLSWASWAYKVGNTHIVQFMGCLHIPMTAKEDEYSWQLETCINFCVLSNSLKWLQPLVCPSVHCAWFQILISIWQGLIATGLKKDKLFVGDISTLYKSGNTTVDVKVDTYSNVRNRSLLLLKYASCDI